MLLILVFYIFLGARGIDGFSLPVRDNVLISQRLHFMTILYYRGNEIFGECWNKLIDQMEIEKFYSNHF